MNSIDIDIDSHRNRSQASPIPRERGTSKPVLIQGEPGRDAVLDHLGVEVATSAEVASVSSHLAAAGLATEDEADTECCYALQDKVWVQAPGKEPWEIYTVKADADTLSPAGRDLPLRVLLSRHRGPTLGR
jgi:hypothetical protein